MLVEIKLRCSLCATLVTIALPEEETIKHALERCACPSCGAARRLRLAPVFPPTATPEVVGREEPPDELGDEELFEHRARVRAWPKEGSQ